MDQSVVLALIGAGGLAFGGVVLKVAEYFLGRGTRIAADATAFRGELRADVIRLTAESAAARVDIAHLDDLLDDCRQKSLSLQGKLFFLEASHQAQELRIAELESELVGLKDEVKRLREIPGTQLVKPGRNRPTPEGPA